MRKSSPYYEKMYQALRAQAQLPGNDNRSIIFKLLPDTHAQEGDFALTQYFDINIVSIKQNRLRDPSIVAEEFLHALQFLVVYKSNPNITNMNRVNIEFEVKSTMEVISRRSFLGAPRPISLWQNYFENQNIPMGNSLGVPHEFSMNLWIRTLQPFPNPQFNAYDLGEYLNFMTLFKAKQQAIYNFTSAPSNEQPRMLFYLFN